MKDCKERGEWAELYFMMQAAGLGMRVLRLFGQTGLYDVGVEHGGRLQRVQVKSTIYRRRRQEYSLNVMGPQRKMYAPGTVDYFAVLLIPAVVSRVSGGVAFAAGAGVDDSGLRG